MSEGKGLTPEQLGILLKVASSKMGKDPVQLKKELSDGSYDQVLGAHTFNPRWTSEFEASPVQIPGQPGQPRKTLCERASQRHT